MSARDELRKILTDSAFWSDGQNVEEVLDLIGETPVQRRITELERVVGEDRLIEALDLAIEAAKAAGRPPVIDLNDPVSENAVAEAIRKLAPEGAYVPLSVRYPWRFSDYTATGQQTNLVDAVAEALRASAAVHESEQLPHLVGPLIALAEALEHGALVPGPPPGPCPSLSPEIVETGTVGFRQACELRAGHAGLHEAVLAPRSLYGPEARMAWRDEEPAS